MRSIEVAAKKDNGARSVFGARVEKWLTRCVLLSVFLGVAVRSLSAQEHRALKIEAVERTAFVRMEENARATISIENTTDTALAAGEVELRFLKQKQRFALPALVVGQEHLIEWPVDTALKPGSYELQVRVLGAGDAINAALKLDIVGRPLPLTMPVVMWGGGDLDRLTEMGFTHKLNYLADYGKIWRAGEPTEADAGESLAEKKRVLNEQLVRGVGAAVYLYPGRWVARDSTLYEEYRRIDAGGMPYNEDNVCASFAALQQYSYNVGASIVQTFGAFPALRASLVHSEIRDATNLCFHEHDRASYRSFSGRDIPVLATHKGGVRYGKIAHFPRKRVVADNDEILEYYRWFWQRGDGWNDLHTHVHEGLRSTGRDDLWTFFDPAVRAPSVWGSGGGVDYISHWTYSHPDPIKIGQVADALFAMAAGRPGQQVMKMTQVIWYRSQTAPNLPADENERREWEKREPEARFITTAPDHLREAFWSKIARPIRGIMYHGWGSLVDAGDGHAYRYTNAESKEVLQELVHTVVQPLGPTLLQVPDRAADVALLESFASQVFAGRGSAGWGRSWESDAHLVLQWAQLQPKIVYDETILRDGLEGVRVLVLPGTEVLTEGVVARINAFQARGGLVVADEHVAPAILPDILLPSYRRSGDPQKDKAVLQERAAELRRELDVFYARYADSSNPDIVLRARLYDSADYLFAVNDKRTFGDYVGQHGLVMEKGLATGATVQVQRSAGYVYDLVEHREISAEASAGELSFRSELEPGGGRVYLIVDQWIAGVELKAAKKVRRGKRLPISVRVVDEEERSIAAVVPVHLQVFDAKGQPAEYSGYYGARDGELEVVLDIAANDAKGEWTLRLTELASGLSAERKVEVK
jgi:hypothetical protein